MQTRMFIALVGFLFLFPSFSNAQLPGLVSMEVEVMPGEEFEGRTYDHWPLMIANDGDHIYLSCVRIKAWAGERLNIEKRSISTQETIWNVVVEEIEYDDLDLIYEESYYHEGDVHLIYRTEKDSDDSLYLLDRVITSEGDVMEPRVLAASWIDDDDDPKTLRYNWNQALDGLSVIAVQMDDDEKTVLVRSTFNKALELESKTKYEFDFPFESVRMIQSAFIDEKSYLFLAAEQEGRGVVGVLEMDTKGYRVVGAGVRHENFRSIELHGAQDGVHMSYLSFDEDDYDEITGYHSSILDFDSAGQVWVTDFEITEEFREEMEDYLGWFSSFPGSFSIKSFIPHPLGGYVVTLHRTHSVEDLRFGTINYYSYEYVAIYVDTSGQVQWSHHIPVRMGSITKEHLHNFIGFTDDAEYILMFPNDGSNVEGWNNGVRRAEDNSDAITIARITPDGSKAYDNIFKIQERDIGLPMTTFHNMTPIEGAPGEFYMWQTLSRSDSRLVRVKFTGIDFSQPQPHEDVLHFGRER
ncbi:MAG: hypothetical protein HWE14_09915 [Flavobacteriia bacterium]|nr:hypothetical protein [Flavobacteriia bacterium]